MKLLFYDLETTGTNPGRNGIHQISGQIVIDNEVKESFDFHVRPNPKATIEDEALIDGKRYKTPGDVAQEMLRECRLWKSKNPDKDVMDIITPDWANYIKQNL
jgi:hypothetical protein